MDTDLIIAAAGVIVVSVVTAWIFGRIARRNATFSILASAVSLLLAVLFVFYAKDRIWWCGLVPSSAVIIWCNFVPVLLAAGAGAAFALPDRPLWRRLLAAGFLSLLAAFSLLQPVLSPVLRPVQGADNWSPAGVCMQSQPATCSPAAGATLLATYNIDTSEKVMAELCLSDAAGTPSLGLYRGLRLLIDQDQMSVEPVLGTADELIEQNAFPALAFVGLPPDGDYDERYVDQWGWIPGLRHSVVIFGRNGFGEFSIGDPSVGAELWTEDDLRLLYRGEGVRIVTE